MANEAWEEGIALEEWGHPGLLRELRAVNDRLAAHSRSLEKLREAVEDHERHIDRGRVGHPPFAELRAAGITRYKNGPLEIELNPAAAPSMWLPSGPAPAAPTQPLDSDIPEVGPPGVPEPAESPSGFGVDHEALAAKLAERAKAMGRRPE